MKLISALLVAAFLVPRQEDQDKALDVFKTYVLHLKNENFSKAATCLHPKSLAEYKGRITRRFGFETPEDLERRVKSLGYATWEELENADPTEVFVRDMKKMSDSWHPRLYLLPRNVESIVGTLKKGDTVYIVAETKCSLDGGVALDRAILYLAYKDGGDWKLSLNSRIEK